MVRANLPKEGRGEEENSRQMNRSAPHSKAHPKDRTYLKANAKSCQREVKEVDRDLDTQG